MVQGLEHVGAHHVELHLDVVGLEGDPLLARPLKDVNGKVLSVEGRLGDGGGEVVGVRGG